MMNSTVYDVFYCINVLNFVHRLHIYSVMQLAMTMSYGEAYLRLCDVYKE